mgnify:CR=1 FL=1
MTARWDSGLVAMNDLNLTPGASRVKCAKISGDTSGRLYKTGDLDEDQVWDIWRLESPTLVCHFRGAPHVHTYVNIGRKA